MLPLFVIVAGSIARMADLPWARSKIGPGLMFIAAGGAPLWGVYVLPVANFGEILFTIGVLATVLRFSPVRDLPAPFQAATVTR